MNSVCINNVKDNEKINNDYTNPNDDNKLRDTTNILGNNNNINLKNNSY